MTYFTISDKKKNVVLVTLLNDNIETLLGGMQHEVHIHLCKGFVI